MEKAYWWVGQNVPFTWRMLLQMNVDMKSEHALSPSHFFIFVTGHVSEQQHNDITK